MSLEGELSVLLLAVVFKYQNVASKCTGNSGWVGSIGHGAWVLKHVKVQVTVPFSIQRIRSYNSWKEMDRCFLILSETIRNFQLIWLMVDAQCALHWMNWIHFSLCWPLTHFTRYFFMSLSFIFLLSRRRLIIIPFLRSFSKVKWSHTRILSGNEKPQNNCKSERLEICVCGFLFHRLFTW